MRDEIVIRQSTKGSILYCIGAFLLAALSLIFLFQDFSQANGILSLFTQNRIGILLLRFVFAVGILFFGYGFFYFCKRAKEGTNLLVVNQEGITDHSSALALGFIPWRDIEKIYLDSMLGNTFIEVVLKDEEAYLSRVSEVARRTMLANKKMGYQLVNITLNSTGISPEELMPQIQEIFRKVKASA